MGLKDRLRQAEKRLEGEKIPIDLADGRTFLADKDGWLPALGDAIRGRPNELVEAAVESGTTHGYAGLLNALVQSRRRLGGQRMEGHHGA